MASQNGEETGSGVLKVVAGPNQGLVLEIEEEAISIGRGPENDLPLGDPSVSTQHARIRRQPDRGVVLEDLGSRNGTFVNARRIDTARLEFGDTIRIGVSEIRYEASLERFALGESLVEPDSNLVLGSGVEQDSEIYWDHDSQILRTLEIDSHGDKATPAEKNLEVVFEVVRQCNAVLSTEELLDRILGILVETFGADRGFVMLLDRRADGRLQQNLVAVRAAREGDARIGVSSSIVDRVIETRSPVLSFDATRDARFSASDSVVEQNVKAVLCAPILRDGEVVGLVHLDSGKASGLFGRKDLDLLKILCDEVALSIENAKLYEKLRRMADHDAAILESLSDGLLVVDTDLVLTTVNPRAERIFGLSARVATGRDARDFESLAAVAEILARSLETGTALEADDLEAPLGPDLVRPILVTTSILREKGGGVRGAIATVRDLTEERELVQRVNRSERLAAMGEAVAGVAHELRNPLTVMRGLTQLIQKRFSPEDAGQEYARMVIEGIDRVSRIIRELLDFARDTKLCLARTAVGDLVASIAREYGPSLAERGHELVLEFEDDLPSVVLDPDKVRQVVVNLLSNAADACPDEGGGRIRLVAARDETKVFVRVADDGVGMKPDILGRIFEPFYTSKDEGTGLGLYISRKLIEQQGGEIHVESELGVGTTFTLEIPLEKRRRSSG